MGKRFQAALQSVVARLNEGQVITAHNALQHETTTVGPYQAAIDRGVRYAVIGWRGRAHDAMVVSAQDAARIFIDRVGTTRARLAARA